MIWATLAGHRIWPVGTTAISACDHADSCKHEIMQPLKYCEWQGTCDAYLDPTIAATFWEQYFEQPPPAVHRPPDEGKVVELDQRAWKLFV
jgi:hypothetical protein